jgi:NB-ARC domain
MQSQFDRAVEFIDRELRDSRQRELMPIELLAIEAIWYDLPYKQMRKDTQYEYSSLRNAASELLQDLSTALEQKVNKRNAKSIILGLQQDAAGKIDLSEAPTEIYPFCGREEQIERVSEWIVDRQAKIVGLMGIGGIGKTTLAARLSESLSDRFDRVIWRSLRESPPATTIITEIVQFLSAYTEIDLPPSVDRQIVRLLSYLRQHRCLVILDNMEAVMVAGALAGAYRSGYEDYGELLHKLGTTRHQSCLLVTSREAAPEIIELATPTGPVYSLFLTGIESATGKLLHELGLQDEVKAINELADRTQGNPLYLRIAANTILNYFDGSIAAFLQFDRLNFSKIANAVQTQFDRLSVSEKLVMYLLAIQREPISIATMQVQLSLLPEYLPLEEILRSLNWRSLLQNLRDRRYTLQNVVMEFMTAAAVAKFSCELQGQQRLFFSIASPYLRPRHLPMSGKLKTDCCCSRSWSN